MVEAQRVIHKMLLAPASISAGGTASATSDVRGYDYATLKIPFAAEVNTSAVNPTVSLQHSDTTDATNYSTVRANVTIDQTAAMQLVYQVDLKSKKRYLKLSATAGTHTTNDLVTHGGIHLELTRNEADPASTTAMVGSTSDAVYIC